MDECQPKHEQIPDLPERVRPLAGYEGKVDCLDALTDPEVCEQVTEDENDQCDARDAHVDPTPFFPVGALRFRGAWWLNDN